MANFTWTFDAPTGTYKSHVMSRRLWESSVELSVFMDHVRPEPAFGRNMGESITLVRVGDVTEPDSAVLQEGVRIPEDEFSLSTTTATVQELGRAVPYTSLARDLSAFDIENPIQRKLRDQMRLVLDTMAASAFKSSLVKYVPTGTAGSPTNNITTNGTPGAQASRNLQFFDVEEIRDYMFDTLRVPPAQDGDYIGVFRTLAMRGLKRDANWAAWHQYTDPQAKYNGEVGRIESVRFIETNHVNAMGKIGASSVLGEGVVFGDDSVALVEAMTPELRAGIPQDHGRSRSIAWYGILTFKHIWDTGNPGEAKVVHVSST